MKVITAPESLINVENGIFLGGSIEMGKAELWQDRTIKLLDKTLLHSYNFVVLNPRRATFSEMEQSINNDIFYRQVKWELMALDKAKYIIMYLSPNTISPISLLELGIHAHSNKLIVVCPEEYPRKGNIDITCEHYGIRQCPTLETAVNYINYIN